MMMNPSISDRLAAMSFYPQLHHLLPYESYDPNTQLFYNENTTGFLLLANPVVGASFEDQQQMNEFFKQEQNLPEGASLQFLLFASPHIGSQLKYWQEARRGEIFQKLALRRREFLEEKAYKDVNDLLVRDFQVVISYTVPGHKLDPLSQQQIVTTRTELKSVLKTLGIQARNGNAEDLIREVGNILNFKNDVYPHQGQWNEHDSLSKQIIDHDKNFAFDENSLLLNDGQTLCRSYTPKVSPNYWSLSNMDRFLGGMLESRQKISTPYMIHYGIFVDHHQNKSRSKVFAKRESLENSLKGGLSKYMPNLHEQYEEITDLATQLQSGERVILSSLSFTLLSTPLKIQEHEQQLRSIWQSCGWAFQPARYDHLPLFLSNLPMTWTLGAKKGLVSSTPYGIGTDLEKMSKAKKTITKEAQNMLPLLGEWKGQNAPGIPLMGRRGQLFFWNPFSKAFLPGSSNAQTDHNYNVCISGAPGSGKSVLMNEMMSTVMGVGGKVFVMDMGRSFKKTCQILGGQHIEFDIRLPISLNPFSGVPTGNDPDSVEEREEMLATICPIFQVMAAPKQGTTDLQNSYLEQAVRYSWEKYGNKSSVDTVKEFLDSHEDLAATNIGQTLYSFSSKGTYGHFFNKPANASFKEKLTVIETDHLRNYPSLMAVVVQMLIIQVNQEMSKGDRKTPFLIIIDEAWKLLSGKGTADFISEATRTARKYKGSIVLGTQHLTDYFKPESPGATEAFNCSAWKCILYQESDVITSLKHHPQLQGFVDTEYKEALLKSIHSSPPHYSEIAIFGPEVNGIVGRLRLDPFSRLLYSTNAEEYRLIEEYINQGASIEEAIELVMEIQAGTTSHAA
jgi:conjugal transfer ATP-binding protein TraC